MLTKLKNKIEDGVSEIGNIKLEEFGIYFSNKPPYFPEGINIIENRNEKYNLIFTERGKITSEISNLTDDEVAYQILKIIIEIVSSQAIVEKNVDVIERLIIRNEFDKVSQLVGETQGKRYRYGKELLQKINPLYALWYESEHYK